MFLLMNRMYKEEIFPDDSAVTFLTKISKKKGDVAILKNNRFIHGKEDLSKLFEKLVVAVLAEKMEQATPQLQVGSRKGRLTRDQLLKVLIVQEFQKQKASHSQCSWSTSKLVSTR